MLTELYNKVNIWCITVSLSLTSSYFEPKTSPNFFFFTYLSDETHSHQFHTHTTIRNYSQIGSKRHTRLYIRVIKAIYTFIFFYWLPSWIRFKSTFKYSNGIITVFYYQLMHKRIVLKGSIKIYIKIAPTCFGVITIIRKGTMWAC